MVGSDPLNRFLLQVQTDATIKAGGQIVLCVMSESAPNGEQGMFVAKSRVGEFNEVGCGKGGEVDEEEEEVDGWDGYVGECKN